MKQGNNTYTGMVLMRIYNWNPLIQNETKNKD